LEGRREIKKLCAAVKYVLPVHRNLGSVACVGEVILEQHWGVLYSDFEEVFKKYYFLNMFSA
jgi:hypothetical protein